MGPAMYEARRPFIERALAGESLSYEADFPRSGGTVHTEIIHVPHQDSTGRTLGLYTVVMDVTAPETRRTDARPRAKSVSDRSRTTTLRCRCVGEPTRRAKAIRQPSLP